MTTIATRLREIGELEGFDVEILDLSGKSLDLKTNGFPRYDFDRKAKGSMTVSEWKDRRFRKVYGGYDCRVLNGDGSVAHGNTRLESVRATYEEQ